MEKEKRQDILLAVICFFGKHGREKELSRAELMDCIVELQKELPLGYEFGKYIPYYSHDLFEDLKDFYIHRNYIHKYVHERPLSKSFISLQPLGREHAKKIIEGLPYGIVEKINKAIEVIIKQAG